MRRMIALVVLGLGLNAAGCAGQPAVTVGTPITLLFAGDIMLGRGVSAVAAADPESVFAGVRAVVATADLSFANLESPLTDRDHVGPSYALEADPSGALLLAAAGFDGVSVANNHAGDAGPPSIVDTLVALEEAGVVPIGGGRDLEEAGSPELFEAGGFVVANLAFDVSASGLAAGDGPGITRWDPAQAELQVARARAGADLVAVAIHGGTEYGEGRDAVLWEVGLQLAAWGVDVVWGHGPHLVQPVAIVDPDGDGRPTVVATSLGNLLFDQTRPGADTGAVLEVLASGNGVLAYRVGSTEIEAGRAGFAEWEDPEGDAALLALDW